MPGDLGILKRVKQYNRMTHNSSSIIPAAIKRGLLFVVLLTVLCVLFYASMPAKAAPPAPTGFETDPYTNGALLTEEDIAERGLRGSSDILNLFGGKAGYPAPRAPEMVIGQIIQGLMVLIGVIFGVLIVYGGYLWMIARGNEDYIKKAKGILEAAIIGFILVVGAYAITNYIVDKVITAAFTPS